MINVRKSKDFLSDLRCNEKYPTFALLIINPIVTMQSHPLARYTCYLLLVLFPLMARATGQIADDVVVNGEVWRLLASPLSHNDSIYKRVDDFLPKSRCWSTANWSGFYGCWEIKDSCLYLKKVVVNMWDEHKKERYVLEFDADTLRSVLSEYYTEHGIYAGWFSQKNLIIGRGELVTYIHGGYLRNHEEELEVTVENGRITHQEHWCNRKVIEGWSCSEADFSETGKEIIKQFPLEQFPELEAERIVVLLKNISLTPDGHFDDCDAIFTWLSSNQREEDPNHPIIVALKKTMREMFPWEVIYLHGKYTVSNPNGRFSLPLGKRQQKKVEE